MAVHPLRPATHRRLGEPLPHQQANRAWSHFRAEGPKIPTFLSLHQEVLWSYQVLPTLSSGYPRPRGRLTKYYSPVRRCTCFPKETFPLDLHVSTTPPAFVLSQDQTLQLNGLNARLLRNAFVRIVGHRLVLCVIDSGLPAARTGKFHTHLFCVCRYRHSRRIACTTQTQVR